MMTNRDKDSNGHIEFISYSGAYPNLCSGKLVLSIDGKEVSFGYNNADYPQFWVSGGWIDEEYNTYECMWEINADELPEQYRQYANEIYTVFNDNVEYGCCGGCV